MTGKLLLNESLANYNSWRVGGCAKQLYLPHDIQDLKNFLITLPKNEMLTWIGLGSNLLIRDQGLNNTVIVTQGGLNQMALLPETNTVRIEAGVACPTAARFCARLGLTGIEFLAGVPGTIGGALKMNAGAHGSETWDFVFATETIDRQGNLHIRAANNYTVNYRHVETPDNEWFVAAHFKLIPGDKEKSLQRIKELLAHRQATQPINLPNCGSVFRNPPGDFAAKLIEACGLKGKSIGGASVSTKHANFIINENNASAKDIENLIELISNEVANKHGVNLIREVHILGA